MGCLPLVLVRLSTLLIGDVFIPTFVHDLIYKKARITLNHTYLYRVIHSNGDIRRDGKRG